MESKSIIPVRVYEEFEPSTTLERNPKFDTLIVHLPDFKKGQLKVQITSTNKLRIQGERPLDNDKWSRFLKELPIASNYDTNEISAKFEDSALHIKHPKIITPADHQPAEPKAEAEAPKEALKSQKSESESSQTQKKGEEKAAAQEVKTPSARYDQSKNGQEQASQDVDPSKTTSMEKQPSQPSRVERASNDVAKTASRKSSEQTSQDADASKITSTEIKQTCRKVSKVGSASADAAKTASRKCSDKKSTDDHFAQGKSTSGAATVEKDKNLDNAADAEKAEKEAVGSSNGIGERYRVEEIKQALGGLVMEMKQHHKIMNMIVAFLMVLVAWIYARNAIGSISKSNN